MDDMQLWFLAAGLLVIGELLTGTFYLLVIGIAFALAGLAAWQHWPLWAQLALASGLTITHVVLLHQRRNSRYPAAEENLDLGQPVEIIHWLSSDHARVRYRGSEWNARLMSPATSHTDTLFIIRDMEGSTLVIDNPPISGV